MYCPNCGSQNQAEIKFCTRCGTNLSVVTEALSGIITVQPQVDERMVKLLKEYYQSRRAALVGALTLPVGLALLMTMFIYALSGTLDGSHTRGTGSGHLRGVSWNLGYWSLDRFKQ